MTTTRPTAPLGRTMLLYLLVVIGLVTLAPFRFQRPEHFELYLSGNEFDVVTNAVLFILPGFVFRLATGANRDVYCVGPLLVFLVVSASAECGQFFLPGRYVSPVDVVTNAAGAWLGAMTHDSLRRNLDPRLAGRVALELPLLGIVYLLVPLLWLHGFASEGQPERLVIGILPGLMGGSVLAAVWYHRFRPLRILGPNRVAVVAGLWFLVAAIHGLRDLPRTTLAAAAGVVLFTRVQLIGDWFHGTTDRRFEGPTLRRVAPLFVAYLVFVDVWPWHGALPAGPLTATWWLSGIGTTPDLNRMLGEIEFVAAATLGGYILAESRGREEVTDLRAMGWATLQAATACAVLELLRGLHAHHSASVLRFVFCVVAALCGAGIYRQQLRVVRAAREARPDDVPQPT